MIKWLLIYICISSFALIQDSKAEEVIYLGRSPRALLVGDAFTSRALDEYSLFYNPAIIGRNDGVSFTPLNPSIGATNALNELDRFEDFPDDAVGISNRLMGFPVYVQTGIYPSFKMGPFAFSMFANSTTSLILRNQTHPILSIDYRLDRGFMMGGAFSFGTGAKTSLWDGRKAVKKKKSSAGTRTSFGFALKRINRQGLSGNFDLFGTELLSQINNSVDSYDSFRRALGFAKGKGWGLDAGVDYIYSSEGFEWGMGFAALDIGNTRFEKTEGDGNVPEQEMVTSLGFHSLFDFGLAELIFSFDLHPLNQDIEFMRKTHFGVELSLPFITFLSGYNSGYLSYGVELNLWAIKIVAGFYGVELSSEFKLEEGERAVVYLSIFNMEFGD